MQSRLVPILILALVSLAGCSLGRGNPEFLIPAKRVAVVRETAERYGANLRWGRLEAAVGMVDREQALQNFGRTAARGTPTNPSTKLDLEERFRKSGACLDWRFDPQRAVPCGR